MFRFLPVHLQNMAATDSKQSDSEQKKHAHAKDGNKEHHIIERIIRSSGRIQKDPKTCADYQGRRQIDFHNFPQTDSEQF